MIEEEKQFGQSEPVEDLENAPMEDQRELPENEPNGIEYQIYPSDYSELSSVTNKENEPNFPPTP